MKLGTASVKSSTKLINPDLDSLETEERGPKQTQSKMKKDNNNQHHLLLTRFFYFG